MKRKTAFLFVAFCMIFGTIAFFSGKADISYAAGGTAYAAKGTPTVDAVKDERYNETMFIELGSDKTAIAEIYALWDLEYVYIYADVRDKTVSHIDGGVFSYNPWNSDSLEVFVDRTLSRSTDSGMPYGNIQLRVDTDNNVSGMVNNAIWAGKDENFEGQAVISAARVWEDNSGYSLEIAIPLSITAPNGVTYSAVIDESEGAKDNRGAIGYDLMLNNAIDSKIRQDTYTWSAGVGAPAAWNTLRFMDEVPEDLRSSNSERVAIPANSNIAAGALVYSDTVSAFEHHFYYALDNNFDTYAQGISAFWKLTVDFRFEVEISKVVVKTHNEIYPSAFKVEYYNSRFNEWETLWEYSGNNGQTLTLNVKDQIGRYYITDETVLTRYIRFIPEMEIVGVSEDYSYAICEFQVYTPDKIQTVSKIANKSMPIETDIPSGGGNVTEAVSESDLVTQDYFPVKVNIVPSKNKVVSWILAGVTAVLAVISVVCCILIKRGRIG